MYGIKDFLTWSSYLLIKISWPNITQWATFRPLWWRMSYQLIYSNLSVHPLAYLAFALAQPNACLVIVTVLIVLLLMTGTKILVHMDECFHRKGIWSLHIVRIARLVNEVREQKVLAPPTLRTPELQKLRESAYCLWTKLDAANYSSGASSSRSSPSRQPHHPQ